MVYVEAVKANDWLRKGCHLCFEWKIFEWGLEDDWVDAEFFTYESSDKDIQ